MNSYRALGYLRNRRLVEALFVVSPTVFVGASAALALWLPAQMHETYRWMAQQMALSGYDSGDFWEPTLAIISILLLCMALMCGAQIQRRHLDALRAPKWISVILVLFVAMPLFGAAGGMWEARPISAQLPKLTDGFRASQVQDLVVNQSYGLQDATAEAQSVTDDIMQFDSILFTFSVALSVLGLLIIFVSMRVYRAVDLGLMPPVTLTLWTVTIVSVTSALVALFIAFPTELPALLTTTGTLCLFFVVLMAWIGYLQFASAQTGRPLIAAVILAAIAFSAFDLNDNHAVRQLHDRNTSARATSEIGAEFKRWLTSRQDRRASTPFPIYIVAAQGGGIYAAYHVAAFLSSVQDECENFSHHIFAISGVSGGSVGAGVFATLMQEAGERRVSQARPSIAACDGRTWRNEDDSSLFDAATEVLSGDLYSPLQAALLFPDFLQRFLFFPVGPFDRARFLDYALEGAWDTGLKRKGFRWLRNEGANPLTRSYFDHWRPEEKHLVPALVFNTTEVHSGRRRVISPFSFGGVDIKFLPVWGGTQSDRVVQLPLDTAAFLSARFPWVTPAGWFYDEPDADSEVSQLEKVRVVDGGYFENSGVVTALDIIASVEAAIASDKALAELSKDVEINLIVLTSAGFSTRTHYGLGEIMEPIRTMLSTRTARAPIEIEKARRMLRGKDVEVRRLDSGPGELRRNLITLKLKGSGYPLPLGWRLSPVSRVLISGQLGNRNDCGARSISDIISMEDDTPDCIRKLLFWQLSGTAN